MVIFSGLALLPDLDYLAVAMGLPNEGPLGHRGAAHSLLPALAVGLLAALLAPRWSVSRWRLGLVAGLVVASHALLDAMTTGSRGAPLLWPFTFHRFAMPWRPIPNAPCGLGYISPLGLRVAATEFIQFFPFLVIAFRPATRRPATGAAPVPVPKTPRPLGAER
jgi:inner membrane protein